jgi:DNA polymerase-4
MVSCLQNQTLQRRQASKPYGEWEAQRLCRDLITVPPQYDQYLKYSKLTQAIYQRYTDLVEPFGMDECWLDISGSRTVFGSARQIAEEIRRDVREELGLTVSIGVSLTRYLQSSARI